MNVPELSVFIYIAVPYSNLLDLPDFDSKGCSHICSISTAYEHALKQDSKIVGPEP